MPVPGSLAAFGASLLMLVIINGAPIVARALLRDRLAAPLDGHRLAPDGRPWLGNSKTVRGVAAAVLAGAISAPLLGYSPTLGAALGLLAMAGDLLSSFIKRRLGIPSSGMALGLDQIPEVLLPVAALRAALGLSWPAVVVEVALFLIVELVLSRLLFRLRLRKRPY